MKYVWLILGIILYFLSALPLFIAIHGLDHNLFGSFISFIIFALFALPATLLIRIFIKKNKKDYEEKYQDYQMQKANTPSNEVKSALLTESHHYEDIETSVKSESITKSNNIEPYDTFGNIHPDLQGLIWIGDGANKNYVHETTTRTFQSKGVVFTYTTSLGTEPSLILTKLPIAIIDNISAVPRPPYYPSYEELSPEQRGVYHNLLQNPYQNIDIGFVFILYYGLERHLLQGNYDRAFNVILKLRDYHDNHSFQGYSANALILTSILKHRPDMLLNMFSSIDTEHETQISANTFLLMKSFLQQPLYANEIMRYSKAFSFTNTRYIKAEPDLFIQELEKSIIGAYGSDSIPLSSYVSKSKRIGKVSEPLFANISIQNRSIDVPDILSIKDLINDINRLLLLTHEGVKRILAERRKKR